MGDYRGTREHRQILLEHAVRIDDDGVVVYKVYSEVVYMTKEDWIGIGKCARQGSLFPEVGEGSSRGSDDKLRLKSQKHGTEEPYSQIQDEEASDETPELTEEECAEWLAEFDDDEPQSNGHRREQIQEPQDKSTAGLNSKPASQWGQATSSSHTLSPSITLKNQQPLTAPRRQWPTSSAQPTRSKGSWGRRS